MQRQVMRDAFIDRLYKRMKIDNSIFFITADFGAPTLDRLRADFPDRFLNVGIAEQNLINVAVGLALEGFTVYVYGIALFLTMRAYEQIRTGISVLTQIRKDVNINLIGVGIGLSYDVVGPTHHCLEDSCIMNVLPNFTIFTPSDVILTEQFVDYTLSYSGPKYIRLDGKALPLIYYQMDQIDFSNGFIELKKGKNICIVANGYMTHLALKVASILPEIGVIDLFFLKPFNVEKLLEILKGYSSVVTMEESFINKGSIDTAIEHLYGPIMKFGFEDKYVFDVGDRKHLYDINGLDLNSIIGVLNEINS
jgi:transketolase